LSPSVARAVIAADTMPDPLLVPSIAMLSGGGLLWLRDYMKRRLEGPEDRYMAMYGSTDWESSNMDLAVRWDPAHDERMKGEFLTRLDRCLRDDAEGMDIWREEAVLEGKRPRIERRASIRAEELVGERRGVYLDMERSGQVRVVWNHMLTDGVGMWSALRPLFDPNPPLVPYRNTPAPPPIVPELMALPSVARRLTWRGRLRDQTSDDAPLTRGLVVWDAEPIRAIKDALDRPFNLVSSALVVAHVFARHPDRERLNVGLTAYFPFLEGRNKYGVFLCKVKRGSVSSIVEQMAKQTKSPLRNWGMSAAQSYALARMPDDVFEKVVGHYRKKIDVLVSSLPVGQLPITMRGTRSVISCHPWELTLPYYFLLVGTREALHVSFTSRFELGEGFLDPDALTP